MFLPLLGRMYHDPFPGVVRELEIQLFNLGLFFSDQGYLVREWVVGSFAHRIVDEIVRTNREIDLIDEL